MALGDILWPYKVASLGRVDLFKELFLRIGNPHTGKMWKSAYPWKTLIYDV
jgi:hypothetical protein